MKNTTYFLPGFNVRTLRKTPRSSIQILQDNIDKIRRKSLSELSVFLGDIIPTDILKPSDRGVNSRRRIFSKENTFWLFFSQIMNADGGCKEVIRQAQNVAHNQGITIPSSSTSAYCQARKKLPIDDLKSIFSETCRSSAPQPKALQGRPVIVADGTGLSMPDTPTNQQAYPQPKSQSQGCGFPQARLLGCFNLYSGLILSYALGNKKSHELRLLEEQWDTFNEGDIFLGDKGFCSFYDIVSLSRRAVDSVVTLARRTPCKASQAKKKIADNDLLIEWKKPKHTKATRYTKEQHSDLPEALTLRQIHVSIVRKGFKTIHFYIITTLLDAEQYPAIEIIDLYAQRWNVELYFRDIKTTMGMDILRCKTPSMVRKEIIMHMIVYNTIRHVMCVASRQYDIPVDRLSLKGALQALRQRTVLVSGQSPAQKRRQYFDYLYAVIAGDPVPHRPYRFEPRVVKRRPKPRTLMTRPREVLKAEYWEAKAA
jgi:hypothetical protein